MTPPLVTPLRLFALALLAACAPSADPDGGADAFAPPDERGPFLAGTFEDAFVGQTGVDLAVQAWFPASDAGDDLYSYDGFLTGTALADGVPACDTPRPVLVFSHGSGGLRYQSIFLTEYLASHGWVVVAPDHTGNTIFDDGDVGLGELALRRPLDVMDTFDWLVDVAAAPGSPLDGCVDADAGYAVAGHSFGGYTSLAVAGATLDADASAAYCATYDDWLCDAFAATAAEAGEAVFDRADPRVWAAIPMAPAGYEVLVGGLADIAVPTLLLGGSLDTETPMTTQVTPDYAGLSVTPRMLGEVAGAGHLTFSDGCAMVDTFAECDDPYLAPEEAHAVIDTATTAFLQWVSGEEEAAAWLPDPDATVLTWSEVR